MPGWLSGGKHGLAQSVFQVGGNFGSAIGPLLAAFIILPHGRISLAWFALAAFGGMIILTALGHWYKSNGHAKRSAKMVGAVNPALTQGQVGWAVSVLLVLIFSKYFYLASITSYYIFYLMHRFHLTVQVAQVDLFIFLGAAAVGTVAGGPIGDRFGRRRVIWVSILGVLPFTLMLPYAGLELTILLSVIIGLILSSAFSAIVVYAQELMPGAGWDGFRAVLWLCFRHGGYWGCGAGLAGGLDEHWHGLCGLFVPADIRIADGVFAEGGGGISKELVDAGLRRHRREVQAPSAQIQEVFLLLFLQKKKCSLSLKVADEAIAAGGFCGVEGVVGALHQGIQAFLVLDAGRRRC